MSNGGTFAFGMVMGIAFSVTAAAFWPGKDNTMTDDMIRLAEVTGKACMVDRYATSEAKGWEAPWHTKSEALEKYMGFCSGQSQLRFGCAQNRFKHGCKEEQKSSGCFVWRCSEHILLFPSHGHSA